ncbi:MAG: hypothetical protein CMF12_13950 [Idiomarina sp.]|uniref:hypothetical protein n=1 Tax=Idiomarina sp. TaxID=1874361 RepID=UPI000C3C0F8C|nr:hypothetical protein [Idiomarina sp.]MBT43609.1 hypothetical protein [Idiomarina sp.]
MRQHYFELTASVPGRGLVTLWRGGTYQRAISARCNHGLRNYKGSKVTVAEVTSTLKKPFGWLEVHHG